MRNNTLIWRLARYIHENAVSEDYNWDWSYSWHRNNLYDVASVIYARILNNEFTGPDNHSD